MSANRNSGIQRKTHSLRLRKQEQGIFGEEEGQLCAERTYVYVAVWQENKRLHFSYNCVAHVFIDECAF